MWEVNGGWGKENKAIWWLISYTEELMWLFDWELKNAKGDDWWNDQKTPFKQAKGQARQIYNYSQK